MSKQTTTLIKGLAILMMLWLHLFNDTHVGAASPLWFIGDVPVVALIARACNPVDIFIVLSGYGFRYTFFHGDVSVRSQLRRLLKLYICYWLTLIIFVGIGSFVNPSNYPGSLSKLLLNVTSLDHTYNYETWFLLPYAIVSIFAKRIFQLQNKIGNLWSLAIWIALYLASCFVISRNLVPQVPVVGEVLSTMVVCVKFVFPFVIGSCLYDIAARSNGLKLRWLSTWKAFALLLLLLLSHTLFHSQAPNPLYAGGVTILMNNISFPSTVDKALSVLGKYSMPMWLTHTYFSIYLFHDFIYGFRYPLLIYVVLVGVSLITSRFMLRASEMICYALYN